ncbi:altronate dehydratase family protein [Psychrosphaera sp. B3R10]|uniref:UxaA family hydrolase n=1 Tax=unclassified Psychrosphaera TaxID=2641570 RepID=UPI001C08DAF9|nr:MULTISPECIES: altronate dehydratase family protein [unclassified Psychrosphaera]MBU2881689.1 altronate dehydratase family protein [Psychrosphaera sp. I2R16]MBU2991056.1 altronate dehydratase family protein [Psychrosphaera sp. B3R10]
MKHIIRLHATDTVAIALAPLVKGQTYHDGETSVTPISDIEKGHKVALIDIAVDEAVIKYGAPIGHAISPIAAGQWVHTDNVKTNLKDELEYRYQPENITSNFAADDSPEVQIYRRANGDVAIRNELWLIPTVGCVNGMTAQMVKEFTRRHKDLAIDGVFAFPHQFGCSQLGDDLETTRVLLQNMAKHPNCGGALVVGLGCENNQVVVFEDGLGDYDKDRVKFLVTQMVEDEVEAGVDMMEQIYLKMQHDKREKGRLSEVKFGLECGGSDGLSGITANPLLGQFSDFLITRGGTTVLTEVPEMFGAETILMSRCKDEETFNDLVGMVNGFKRYYKDHNQPIYENPSPGNKNGGITTLEDKSLGCTQKAGLSPVQAVLKYGEIMTQPGLNLLDAPGNDAIATSALAASGCHMVLFTTGRGTPYGGWVPTLKIATNSEMATKKRHWIDFDAGRLVTDTSMEDLLAEFIDLLVRACNGEQVKNELNEIREVAIWKKGVTL